MSRAQPAESEWTASWEDTEKLVIENALRATPAQRLAWLEDAIRLAYASGALPREPDSGITGPETG